jgi:hypothetical protein
MEEKNEQLDALKTQIESIEPVEGLKIPLDDGSVFEFVKKIGSYTIDLPPEVSKRLDVNAEAEGLSGGQYLDKCLNNLSIDVEEEAKNEGITVESLLLREITALTDRGQWLEFGVTFNSDSRSVDDDKDFLGLVADTKPICDGDVNLVVRSPFSKKATLRAIGKIKDWIDTEWVENDEEMFIPIRCTHIDGGVSGPRLKAEG